MQPEATQARVFISYARKDLSAAEPIENCDGR